MSWTKRQFISSALEEIGLASYEFDIDPMQQESAMRRLDALMASWNARGIRIGYPIPSSPENSDLDQETEVPDSANMAIILALAIVLAPSYGKMVSPDTKRMAKESYRTLLNSIVEPIPVQFPGTMPRGAGHKPHRGSIYNEFLNPPVDPILAGKDSTLDFE